MASNFDVDAWLGPYADEVTHEQRDRMRKAFAMVDARFPDEDAYPEREQALNAAAQVIVGDDTLEGHAGRYLSLRRQEQEAWARATGAIIGEATGGAVETRLAERSGMTRMSVRKALGK